MSLMTSRERVRRTLRFEGPDRAPRDLWMLGTVPIWYGEELADVLGRYPTDFARAPLTYRKQPEAARAKSLEMQEVEKNPLYATSPGGPRQPTPTFTGRYVDEWGCEWEVLEPGVVGEVVRPRLADWSNFTSFVPPYELLDEIDLSPSVPYYAGTDRFVLCSSTVEPFQRLLFLRGFENIMLDFGYETPNMLALLGMLHEFNVRQLHLLAPVAADAIMFKDDWGSQSSLLISPRQWRKLFKPLYAEYVQIIHDAGKFAFFHSDGQISAIFPDLIEIGVDAVNSQLFCMDIEEMGRKHKGKITFWGEIDRQKALPFGTPQDVREAVYRVRRALDDGRGGVIAQCEWANDTPAENIEAVFEAWAEPSLGSVS